MDWTKTTPIEWPPKSPDITPLDFFLWGYLMSKVYPEFLKNVVPYRAGLPDKCLRYNYTLYVNKSDFQVNKKECQNRDTNETIKCNQFVFERPKLTIVHEFNIFCIDNLWKLTLVGTINVIGELINLSYTGFLSDRYGRNTIMSASVFLSALCGICKSFSQNYYTFISFEFLDTALGGAMYGAAFVLAMELVTANDRDIANVIISCIYALGQVVLGAVAWLTPNWRVMVRSLYFPGLFSIFIWIFLPESVRWLLSKRKHHEAIAVLSKIASVNGNRLSLEETQSLENKWINMKHDGFEETNFCEQTKTKNESFWTVLKTPLLLARTIHCSLTWVCCTFVFYGLTIHSVEISKNIHLSFILGAIAETPGYVIYYYANAKSGRRKLMFASLVSGGLFCLAVGFLPEGWLKLATFFGGKCSLTIAYTVLYVYTTELFPTSSRHAMFSICSMFGRIGSMVAPQIPLLANISKTLPIFLFSAMSFMFGFLALLLPETYNIHLPHTVEEAVTIGRKLEI
ncbi:solute carrier family 22 member 3-like isoform X2 [Anthonomus grandis grandis]|uniref:solute carrier family 22 member 3-like isoform X2 n=1 Tax=Anthonomus grandis grandis TaxID=2921223 RepID=UPI002165F4C2|nr:solute carrier family 22 member 3-like isoform X2 [Anthonomus grandis grandis]XP_050293327.1 solute carrier family 22 member 3-like isoform X2 [Anthonomus grandis grandis]